MPERPPTRAVYTALIGGYERLQEQPIARTTDIPFICLTDDPALTSETWQVRVVQPLLERDASRSSRYPKILGEPLVPEYHETLWIDNLVLLRADPVVVLDQLLDDADVAVMHHSHRESVMAEFDEVARKGLDEPARIYEQLIHYAETKPHILDQRPYWGGFIARRWTPGVHAAMRTWMDHVLRYSRRDQLSFRYALDGLPRVRALDIDNFDSDWHTWTTDHASVGRMGRMRSNAFQTSIRAPLAVVAEREREVAALRAQLDSEKEHRDRAAAKVVELRSRTTRLRARVAGLRQKLARERERSARLQAQVDRGPARRAAGAVRTMLTRRVTR
jgi:hypothetical protein